jgi:hypothetical protein
LSFWKSNSSVCTATGYGVDWRGYVTGRSNKYCSVGIATSYGLYNRGVGVRVPVWSKKLSSPDRRHRLRSTQPPIQWVPGAIFTGIKRPGREVDHSPPSSAEVKKMWIYTSTPIRLHGVVLNLKRRIFWDVSCILLHIYRRFGKNIPSPTSGAKRKLCLPVCLLDLLLYPEDGGIKLFRTVSKHLSDYQASHPRNNNLYIISQSVHCTPNSDTKSYYDRRSFGHSILE